jgi:hypothetical protein
MSSQRAHAFPGIQIVNIESTEIKNFDSNTIAVVNGLPPQTILDLALNSSVRHICQSSTPSYDQDVASGALMLQNPALFFECPMAVALDPEFASAKRERQHSAYEFKFNKLDQKVEMLGSLQQVLTDRGMSTTLQSEVMTVADELFTNAVYNAPVEPGNGPRPRSLSEAKRVVMGAGKQGRLSLGIHQDRMVLVCSDPYGSLELPVLLRRIRDCYVLGVDKMMNQGPGGAGIGSYMVYEATASYFVAVQPGVATVVASCMPLRMSATKRLRLLKNIHLIGF